MDMKNDVLQEFQEVLRSRRFVQENYIPFQDVRARGKNRNL